MISRYRKYVNPKVSIIILHLNNISCLLECISSLNKINYPNFDIFVVHNGPKCNALPEALAQLSQHIIEIIDTGDNIGFSGGNNVGIRQALEKEADYVLLLNDDTEVDKDFLSILVEIAEMREYAAMFGPRIFFFDHLDRIWFDGAIFDPETCMLTTPGSDRLEDGMDSEPMESDYITGCALLINRRAVERIGLLDERFFLYWEDVDWGLRSKKAGFMNVVIPAAHIWHKVSVSSGGMDSLIRAYHKTRSHLLMARLHAPNALPKLHVQYLRDIAWLLIKSQDQNCLKKARAFIIAIRDYYIGKTDKGPDWLWK